MDYYGLPASPETENILLGAIFASPEAFIEISATIAPESFTLEANRRIFRSMLELHQAGEPIDRITVFQQLEKRDLGKSVGGLTYLAFLGDGMPILANPDAYAEIVKEHARRRQIILEASKATEAAMEGTESAAAIATRTSRSLVDIASDSQKSNPELIGENIRRVGIEELCGRKRSGIQTGFAKLDQMTGGLAAGDVFALGGRPSHGKSAIAANIATNIVLGPNPQCVHIFSLEMSRESLIERMLCSVARVNLSKKRGGWLSSSDRVRLATVASQLARSPLVIDEASAMTPMDMQARALRVQSEHGLGLVIIDYVQLIRGGKKFANRESEVSDVSRSIKLMAGQLRVPIIAICSLSRACETRPGDHRPMNSDLRESGGLESDADLIGFMYREELYKPDREDLKGEAELMLTKHRNGPIGRVSLVFLGEIMKFENRAGDLGSVQ